ncbi:MAG: hypothetical protein ACM679_06935 [Bacteroidales bacterium]
MKKTLLSVCLAALSLTSVSAQDEKPITEKPKGEIVNLYRTSEGYYAFFGNAKPYKAHGEWSRMVFAEDGAVWLENPISSLYSKTWIKGYKAQGDTIAFDLPQVIYEETFDGVTSKGKLYKMIAEETDKYGTYVKDEDSQTLKYLWKDGKLTLCKDMACGMCTPTGGWSGFGENYFEGINIENNTTKPSENAKVYDGLMLYLDLNDHAQQWPVKYAIDGDDVYLGNLSTNLKGYWIKGTMKNNEVTFPSTSLVGIDTTTVCYAYASRVDYSTAYTAYGDPYDSTFVVNEPLVFTYDPAANTLNSKQKMGIHQSDGVREPLKSTDIFDVYRVPLISPWVEKPNKPLPPKFSAVMPWITDMTPNYSGVEFLLSYYSVDGNYLDPSKLYYSFYIDGEMVTFTPEEYLNVTKEMDLVPYTFDDDYQFYKVSDNTRRLYYYHQPKEKIGLEALYVDEVDGKPVTYSSGISEYYFDPTGINNTTLEEGNVESITFTDLSGRQILRPGKGVYIRTITMKDGTKQSKKVVR